MSQKPTAVALDQVEVVPAGEAPTGTRIARLVTRAGTGSSVLVGVSWMDPGEASARWTVPPGAETEEVYYVIRGRIRVDWDDGQVEAGPDAAVYFPPGFSYQVTAVSPDPVFLAYTLYPTSR
jgi:mannose-6-phosphate isomerase-like protein (cupin superfamily)